MISHSSKAITLLFFSATFLIGAQEEEYTTALAGFLRNTKDSLHNSGNSHDAATSVVLNEEQQVEDKPKPDEEIKSKVGMKCGGGLFENKGYFVNCTGGITFGGFHVEPRNQRIEDVRDDFSIVASSLYDHMKSNDYILKVGDFMPSPEDIEKIEKKEVVEVGGFDTLGWGCRMKSGHKEGKLVKKIVCGMTGMKGMGMNSTVDIDHYIRNVDGENSDEQLVDDILLDVNDMLVDRYEFYDLEDNKPKPNAEFGLVKGVECSLAAIDNKGDGLKCEGGFRYNMTKNDGVYMKLAQGLYDHMNEGYLLGMNELMPSDDVLPQVFEKEHGFGGYSAFKWGCKLTTSDDSFVAECGMKAIKEEGVIPKDMDKEEDVDVTHAFTGLRDSRLKSAV